MAPAQRQDDDAVQQIKARIDLVQLIQERVQLTRRGRQWVGLCPFHSEDTPSFYVTPEQQFWKCFGCERRGDIFTFVELAENLDFKGALDLLAERAGIALTQEGAADRERRQLRLRLIELNRLAAQYYEYVLHSLAAGEPGRALLAQRQVSEENARRFQLGHAPGGTGFAAYLRKRDRSIADAVAAGLVRRDGRDFFQQRLIIPVRDERGQPVAFVGRTTAADPRKYINSPDTPAYTKSRVVFGLDLAREDIGRAGHAVLVEGQFDVISAHGHGIVNAVASSGTAFTGDQMRLLKRFTEEVLIAFDTDSAGRTAVLRAVETAAAEHLRTRVVVLEGAKDPDDFLRAAGSEAGTRWQEVSKRALPGWEYWIRDAIRGLNPARPDDLEVALDRVQSVLARISDAGVREAYRVSAATWLGVDAAHVRIGSARAIAQAGAESSDAVRGGSEQRDRRRRGGVGTFLLQVLAVRPESAEQIASGIDTADLDEADARTYTRMLEAIAGGGLEGNLAGFDDAERELIREAWGHPPPGLDDSLVEDVIARVREEAINRQMRLCIVELGEADRSGDRGRIAAAEARYRQLAEMRLRPVRTL